jgi:hypothetical protein
MKTLSRLTLLAIGALAARPVAAGENKYLGRITVAGASLTNATTAAPFVVAPGSKVTIYCSAAANILVDNLTATTTTGVPVAATTLFPTSVGAAKTTLSGQQTAVIAVIGTGNCDVWQRDGNE